MISSTLREPAAGLHVAIIMDGSGRWAQARGLRRSAGHRAGVESVRRIVSAAPRMGIGTLTLHAFSSEQLAAAGGGGSGAVADFPRLRRGRNLRLGRAGRVLEGARAARSPARRAGGGNRDRRGGHPRRRTLALHLAIDYSPAKPSGVPPTDGGAPDGRCRRRSSRACSPWQTGPQRAPPTETAKASPPRARRRPSHPPPAASSA